MRSSIVSLTALMLIGATSANATEPTPEITRALGSPQRIGQVHTVRGLPEACARLEGQFTGKAAQPYVFAAVKTSSRCQPRARLLNFARAKPSLAQGWKLNDVIRIPSAECPSLQAVIRVWRKPGEAAPPKLDAQGRSRIYLQDAAVQAKAGQGPAGVSVYAAEWAVEGSGCGG